MLQNRNIGGAWKKVRGFLLGEVAVAWYGDDDGDGMGPWYMAHGTCFTVHCIKHIHPVPQIRIQQHSFGAPHVLISIPFIKCYQHFIFSSQIEPLKFLIGKFLFGWMGVLIHITITIQYSPCWPIDAEKSFRCHMISRAMPYWYTLHSI